MASHATLLFPFFLMPCYKTKKETSSSSGQERKKEFYFFLVIGFYFLVLFPLLLPAPSPHPTVLLRQWKRTFFHRLLTSLLNSKIRVEEIFFCSPVIVLNRPPNLAASVGVRSCLSCCLLLLFLLLLEPSPVSAVLFILLLPIYPPTTNHPPPLFPFSSQAFQI